MVRKIINLIVHTTNSNDHLFAVNIGLDYMHRMGRSHGGIRSEGKCVHIIIIIKAATY
jgi:hypothetical protein